MNVLRFPSPKVSPNHPSLGMIWAQDHDRATSHGSVLDLFPADPDDDWASGPVAPVVRTDANASRRISCGDCTMANTDACTDCVVALLADGPAEARSVTLDAAEAQTIDLFSRAGLVPKVRHCDRFVGRAASW